jgi:hypothetical protein
VHDLAAVNPCRSVEGGALTSLSDDESIDDEIDDNDTLTPVGSGTDTGSAHLGGPVDGDIHQTGGVQNGAFALAPATGDDSVDLTGNYHNTVDKITPGGIPGMGIGVNYPYQAPATPTPQLLATRNEVKT